MAVRSPARFIWRYMLRRIRQSTANSDVRIVWRRVLHRVPETDVSSSASPSKWDTQSITYADCEAFFEAVSKGSRKKLIVMLYDTYGRDVAEELAKSYNEDGETPLLVAIRQGNLKMVKFLTQKLNVPVSQQGQFVREGVEYSEVPPLFAAVVCGQLDIVRCLIAAELQSGQILTSINSIVSSSNDRQQKIDMLELLGAVYLSSYQHGTREPGLLCWKEAMNLRNSTMDGWQVIPKPETSFLSDVAHKSLGYAFEFTTLEELDQLSASDLDLITQTVLVSQRVMYNFSARDDLFSLALLKRYVEICHKKGEYSRVICSTVFFLGFFHQHLWDILETTEMVSWILHTAIRSFKKSSNGLTNNHEEFTFANLTVAFEFACDYAIHLEKSKLKRHEATLFDLAYSILRMVLLIVKMFPQLNANEIQQFKCSLYRFIRMDHQWGYSGKNLLHMICSSEDRYQLFDRPLDWKDYMMFYDNESDRDDNNDSSPGNTDDDFELIDVENQDEEEEDEDEEEEDEEEEDEEEEDEDDFEIPSLELQISVIRLFLELGADPNSTSLYGETPLHFLTMWSRNFGPAQVILEHGGHVDQTDQNGFTPLMHFRRWQRDFVANGIVEPRLQALLNNILPLSCLAAKVLRENRVPFDKEMPATLHSFVCRH